MSSWNVTRPQINDCEGGPRGPVDWRAWELVSHGIQCPQSLSPWIGDIGYRGKGCVTKVDWGGLRDLRVWIRKIIRSDYGQTDRPTEFPLVKIKKRMKEFKHWRCNPPLESLRRLHSSNSSWFCKNSLPRFKTIWNTETQKMHQLILVPNIQNHHMSDRWHPFQEDLQLHFENISSGLWKFRGKHVKFQVYCAAARLLSNVLKATL